MAFHHTYPNMNSCAQCQASATAAHLLGCFRQSQVSRPCFHTFFDLFPMNGHTLFLVHLIANVVTPHFWSLSNPTIYLIKRVLYIEDYRIRMAPLHVMNAMGLNVVCNTITLPPTPSRRICPTYRPGTFEGATNTGQSKTS